MAQYASHTSKYLNQSDEQTAVYWRTHYEIGDIVPVSGIYRCVGCGDEITSNKYDPFPPQNKHQHTDAKKEILWELIVKTQTTGSAR